MKYVVFEGADSSGQFGLWVTNGTTAGTHELTGINGSYPAGFNLFDLTPYNTKVLFNGTDASGNQGLWVTNGTAAGTYELLAPGFPPTNLYPSELTVFKGKVYLNGGAQLWQSMWGNLWFTDGTGAGTHGVPVATANWQGLNPTDLTVFNDEMLFNGVDSDFKHGLWVSDGTAIGTF
jgi:ELWxxDGT repeat protein